jgi:hypothetical protein
LFVNRAVSLAAFVLLLGAGWVALSYLKSDVLDRWRSGSSEPAAASKAAAAPVADAASSEAKDYAATVRLVYSCAGDKNYYHTATHLSARCERTALSEQAAVSRGLKRCKVCLPD